MKTVQAEIIHADIEMNGEDRQLFVTLMFPDTSDEPVQYVFRESVHGNEVLFKLLKGAGYAEEKRFDKLFSDLIGSRVRARINEEGALCGVGHRLKNRFFMWNDRPVYPAE